MYFRIRFVYFFYIVVVVIVVVICVIIAIVISHLNIMVALSTDQVKTPNRHAKKSFEGN